jgi:hypothetical protein
LLSLLSLICLLACFACLLRSLACLLCFALLCLLTKSRLVLVLEPTQTASTGGCHPVKVAEV